MHSDRVSNSTFLKLSTRNTLSDWGVGSDGARNLNEDPFTMISENECLSQVHECGVDQCK